VIRQGLLCANRKLAHRFIHFQAKSQNGRPFQAMKSWKSWAAAGWAVVYKARQIRLDRLVAVKFLPRQASGDATFAERFNREARALARLAHPNIVAVYDAGQEEGQLYFIMEFVEGISLADKLRNGRLAPAEAIGIIVPICDALQYAHDEGIVHRDIKPGEYPAGQQRPREGRRFRSRQAAGPQCCRLHAHRSVATDGNFALHGSGTNGGFAPGRSSRRYLFTGRDVFMKC